SPAADRSEIAIDGDSGAGRSRAWGYGYAQQSRAALRHGRGTGASCARGTCVGNRIPGIWRAGRKIGAVVVRVLGAAPQAQIGSRVGKGRGRCSAFKATRSAGTGPVTDKIDNGSAGRTRARECRGAAYQGHLARGGAHGDIAGRVWRREARGAPGPL